MEGRRENLVAPADLHDVTAEQHADAIGKHPHDGKVMRDEQHGDAALGLQSLQEREDARLNRDIQCRQDFVAQQQGRLGDKAACDGDALALAARQFVGKALGIIRVQPDIGERRDDMSGERLPKKNSQRPRQRLADARARIERGIRVLEHELDQPALVRRCAALTCPASLAGKHDASLRRGNQPGDRPRQRRFSAAEFADQSEGFAFADMES